MCATYQLETKRSHVPQNEGHERDMAVCMFGQGSWGYA